MYMVDQLVLTLLETINELPEGAENDNVRELKKSLQKYVKKSDLKYE